MGRGQGYSGKGAEGRVASKNEGHPFLHLCEKMIAVRTTKELAHNGIKENYN